MSKQNKLHHHFIQSILKIVKKHFISLKWENGILIYKEQPYDDTDAQTIKQIVDDACESGKDYRKLTKVPRKIKEKPFDI